MRTTILPALFGLAVIGCVNPPGGAGDTESGEDRARPEVGRDTVTDGGLDVSADGGSEEDVSPMRDPGREAPNSVRPCEEGADCWETSLGTPPCATTTHDEDYSSGDYNAHWYAATLWEGTSTTIRVDTDDVDWDPVLVLRGRGETWFDGQTGADDADVQVDVVDATEIVVTPATTAAVQIFVTGRGALETDWTKRLPLSATYTLTVESDCGGDRVDCVVNGNSVREPACGWLHYVGRRVVPALGGPRADRITDAARVAWWSLKEGVMFLDNPIVYSNCNFPDGDARIGPLETCVEGRAWQVGLSAIQVPNYPLGDVESRATTLYPGMTVDDVLRTTAAEAAVDPTTAGAVVASTGALRKSWLLRNSAVGFSFQVGTVTRECIDDTRRWCYGTGWDATRMFAPDRAAALQAIVDIEELLDQVSPP